MFEPSVNQPSVLVGGSCFKFTHLKQLIQQVLIIFFALYNYKMNSDNRSFYIVALISIVCILKACAEGIPDSNINYYNEEQPVQVGVHI